jgi:hypothetical protein
MQINYRKIIAVLLALILLPLVSLDAFAQHGHDPPPATIGDRKLTVSLNLDAIAGDSNEYLCSLKLVDVGTNKAVPHVTFFVTLKKEGTVLFKEWFHDHEGDLPLKIRPKDTGKVTVFGVKEPTLNGYMKSGEDPVVIEGPVLIANGVYDFIVEIFSIDNDKTLLNAPLKYEISVPVGKTEEPSKPSTQRHDHQTDISVAMKLAKKTTLLAIKNTGDMEVHSVKIKASDGSIRFVKAKGWDREKVDSNTVIIKTMDKPISSGKNLLVMLIIDNNASGIEWTAFDANATTLSSGALIPEL